MSDSRNPLPGFKDYGEDEKVEDVATQIDQDVFDALAKEFGLDVEIDPDQFQFASPAEEAQARIEVITPLGGFVFFRAYTEARRYAQELARTATLVLEDDEGATIYPVLRVEVAA